MQLIKEIWRDIKDYEGLYQISNFGNVKSFTRSKTGIILKPLNNGANYLRVEFRKNNRRYVYSIHRLVGLHFIANPENKPCINHKDGNRQNNNVNNLEWVTSQENTIHAYRNYTKQTAEEKKESRRQSSMKYLKNNRDKINEKRRQQRSQKGEC